MRPPNRIDMQQNKDPKENRRSFVEQQLKIIQLDLQRFSLKLTGDKVKADDLVQNTLLRILSQAERFQPGTNFKAWAATIMKNIFINDYRKHHRRSQLLEQIRSSQSLAIDNKVTNNQGDRDLELQDLTSLTDRLPDDFRIPFMLAHQGYKYEEIAKELKTPVGTIKSRIFFARKRLQKMYRKVYKDVS